jgi:hypothetical protein
VGGKEATDRAVAMLKSVYHWYFGGKRMETIVDHLN